jgi:anti-sigma regulatory factor (Ser/Thr protein kinase)
VIAVSADGSQLIATGPSVRLELDSRPETLTLVRGMLGGVAEWLTIDPELLDDLKTAVSEACNNVVLHAYPDSSGPLDVELYLGSDQVVVIVRDSGTGLDDMPLDDDRFQGVGMPVIRALTVKAEFGTRPEGGTEVRMTFAGSRDGKPLFQPPVGAVADDGFAAGLTGDAVASVSPPTLVAGVLGRLARALAANARFSLDRFSDVYLVTDAIAAHAEGFARGQRVSFALTAGGRQLELRLGPLRPGSAAALSSADGSDSRSPLQLLSDTIDIEPLEDGEMLRVVMIDHRRWSAAGDSA